MNPKIGTYAASGAVYPTETITGKPYQYDTPPAIVHDLLNGHFAIGDVFPPRDFDVEAALMALNDELSASAPSKPVKTPLEPKG